MKRFSPALPRNVIHELELLAGQALNVIQRNPEKFSSSWEDAFHYCPEGDFSWKMDECGDWTYWEKTGLRQKDCLDLDDGEWEQSAYTMSLFRLHGMERVEFNSCDCDGNWECDCAMTREDYDKDPRDFHQNMSSQHCYSVLLKNHLYELYCVETGKDPLENVMDINIKGSRTFRSPTRQEISDISARELEKNIRGLCADVAKVMKKKGKKNVKVQA